MKTIKNNEETVRRVDDSTADMLIKSGSWFYCGKEEYKKFKSTKKKSSGVKSDTPDIENRGLSDKKLRKERKLAKSKKNRN